MKSTEPAAATPVRVWDLPVRLVHWALVALLGLSWWTAETEQLELHFYSGYAILTLLLFRILWGFFGSSTARFSAFVRGPSAVLKYVRNRFRWPVAGHAPLGALSVLALLLSLLLQVATGLINSDNDGLVEGPLAAAVSLSTSDAAHDLHELLFTILQLLVVLHVAAILLYRVALGRNLLSPMITGKTRLDPDVEPMRPAKWWVALLCLVAALAFTRWIIAGAPPFGT